MEEIKLEQLLKHMRDQIANQAQEIAVLKATIENLLPKDEDKVE